MAAIGISEFTFGYAFLYEQTHANWANLLATPVLPSLQQEQHGGWDAHLPLVGADYYYQFKLTDHLSRSNSKFIADGTYAAPYYRLAFHRRNNNQQHQRLRIHAATHPNTFYVAPEFQTIDQFNSAFLSRQIASRSRVIPLSQCDDVSDNEQHFITFRPGSRAWIQHSQMKRRSVSYKGEDMEALYRRDDKNWRKIDGSFASDLFSKTVETVNRIKSSERWVLQGQGEDKVIPLLDFDPQAATMRETLLRTSQILSVALGVTLVIVGSKE